MTNPEYIRQLDRQVGNRPAYMCRVQSERVQQWKNFIKMVEAQIAETQRQRDFDAFIDHGLLVARLAQATSLAFLGVVEDVTPEGTPQHRAAKGLKNLVKNSETIGEYVAGSYSSERAMSRLAETGIDYIPDAGGSGVAKLLSQNAHSTYEYVQKSRSGQARGKDAALYIADMEVDKIKYGLQHGGYEKQASYLGLVKTVTNFGDKIEEAISAHAHDRAESISRNQSMVATMHNQLAQLRGKLMQAQRELDACMTPESGPTQLML